MVPPKIHHMISSGNLSAQYEILKKKSTIPSQNDGIPPFDTPSHDAILQNDTAPQNHASIDTLNDTESTNEIASSSRRKRGRNKNFALAKLSSGEKLPLIFNQIDKKPMCENRKIWSRQLGAAVRDDGVIKHRTLRWDLLSTTDMNYLWQAATNKFVAENMDSYRDATLAHMKLLWDKWRCDLHIKHIKPQKGDMDKIKSSKPHEFTQEDWEWLLTHHFLTDHFKKSSNINAGNRKNVQYVHYCGSKPFSQVGREMEITNGHPPTYIDIFLETHSRKDKRNVDADVNVDTNVDIVQQKFAEMRQVMNENSVILIIDLTESVFGAQKHGHVIGMGSGVQPSKLRGDQRNQTLRNENASLQKKVDKLMSYHKTAETRRLADLKVAEERRLADKAEFDRKLAFIMAQIPNCDMPPDESMPPTTLPSNIDSLNLDHEEVN